MVCKIKVSNIYFIYKFQNLYSKTTVIFVLLIKWTNELQKSKGWMINNSVNLNV